jgi:predicted ATPase/DNA-binding SARP family transcriptional activator
VLEFSILGPLEIRRDGVPIRLVGALQRAVLLRLLVARNRVVPAELLIEDVWGDDAPPKADNALQSKVSQIRRTLGDASVLAREGVGYVVRTSPGSVDADRFDELVEAGRRREADGDPRSAAEAFGAAVELWRGDPLVEVADRPWAVPIAAALHEDLLVAKERLVSARLDAGAAGELVPDLELAVAAAPLRERTWHQLMTAYYRAGRQADALTAYQRVRAILGEELGLDPGPELQALESMILNHDAGLAVAPARREAATAVDVELDVRRSAAPVPAPLSALVGRAADIAAVQERLAQSRLVTITGAGGAGKTRLSIEVARLVDGDVSFVALDGVSTDEDVAAAVSSALRLADADAREALIHRYSSGPALLVLDNCEHVIDGACALVVALLEACPDLRILATSQELFAIDGEARWHLDPLPVEDAVDLFVQRARAAVPGFAADAADRSVVHRICEQLDGAPLAIELAAARARALRLTDLAARLDDRFSLLRATGRSTRSPRHQSLEATIAWSYDLLFESDQDAVMALSVFAGGIPTDGALRVLGVVGVPDDEVTDALARLTDRSLLTVDLDRRRFRMLESLRLFAHARLEESGRAAAVAAAHAAWIADLASELAAPRTGPVDADRTRTERANIAAALRWLLDYDAGRALAVATDLAWPWYVSGQLVDGAAHLARALAAADDPPLLRARALAAAGLLGTFSGHLPEAIASLRDAVSVLDADGAVDPREAAQAHCWLATSLSVAGRMPESDVHVEAARQRMAQDDHWLRAIASITAALNSSAQGRRSQARRECEQGLTHAAVVGDPWIEQALFLQQGWAASAGGDWHNAVPLLQRAADAARTGGFLSDAGQALTRLGRAQWMAGDVDGAVTSLEHALDLAVTTGDPRIDAMAAVNLGTVLVASGRDGSRARLLLERAETWYRQTARVDSVAMASVHLAQLDVAAGRLGAAHRRLAEVLTWNRQWGDRRLAVLALDTLARALASGGTGAAAARVLAAADERAASDGPPLAPAERGDVDRLRAELAAAPTLADVDADADAAPVDPLALLAELGVSVPSPAPVAVQPTASR